MLYLLNSTLMKWTKHRWSVELTRTIADCRDHVVASHQLDNQCRIQWVQHRISPLSRLPSPQLNSTVRRSTRSVDSTLGPSLNSTRLRPQTIDSIDRLDQFRGLRSTMLKCEFVDECVRSSTNGRAIGTALRPSVCRLSVTFHIILWLKGAS